MFPKKKLFILLKSLFCYTYRYHCLRYPCNSFLMVSSNRILPSLQCKHTCIRHPLRCIVHYVSNHFRIQLQQAMWGRKKKSTIYEFSAIFFVSSWHMRAKRGEIWFFHAINYVWRLINHIRPYYSYHISGIACQCIRLICWYAQHKKVYIYVIFCEKW